MNNNEYVANFFLDSNTAAEEKTRTLLKKFITLVTESDFEGIEKLFKETKQVKYSGQGYMESIPSISEEMQQLFYVGYNYSIVDSMQLYMEKLTVEREISSIKTKYKNFLLYTLAMNGTMFHKDLATTLGLSPSGLSAVIKQMNATPVKTVTVEEFSKFKLYSLTPTAFNYVKRNNIENYFLEKNNCDKSYLIAYKNLESEIADPVKEDYYNLELQYTVRPRTSSYVQIAQQLTNLYQTKQEDRPAKRTATIVNMNLHMRSRKQFVG